MPTELALSDLILARLDDHWWQVFDADVPATPPGAYVIVWPGHGAVTSGRLDYQPLDLRAEWRLVCCGRSRAQVMDVVTGVRDLLGGWRPYPDRRDTGPVWEVDTGAELLSDRAAGETRFSLTLTYRLATTRS